MDKITQLTDDQGNNLYPKTLSASVYDGQGRSLDALISNQVYIDTQAESVEPPVNTIDAALLGGKTPSYYATSGKITELMQEIASLKQRISALENNN